MVDGINNANPRLPGPGETSDAAIKTVALNTAKKSQSTTEPNQIRSDESNSVSSAIAKAADKRLQSLTSGNVLDYLQAAEKFIDASLPSKPPGTKLRINVDDGSGRFVYQGIDVNTGDVITQFPSEEILKFVSFIREREGLEGIVVDEQV
ncbi:MAG: flagellar protein FlaG [Emcibacter sp.]|nr:flagellar protein FlaG [Emcibacter sp.]